MAGTAAAIAMLLTLLISLAGCDSEGSPSGPVPAQDPESDVASFEASGLDSGGFGLATDGTYDLGLIARDAQGNAVAAEGMEASSSNPSVATLSSGIAGTSPTGEPWTVYAVRAGGGEGDAILTFRDPASDATLSIPLRVRRVAGFSCCGAVGSSVALQPGETAMISVQATDSQGNELSNVDVGASSSDAGIVSVSGATRRSPQDVEFTLTGGSPGSAVVTLSGGGLQRDVQVSVSSSGGGDPGGDPGAPGTRIEVEGSPGSSLTLSPLQSALLTARAFDSQGNPITGAVITGSSSNPTVATVTPTAPGSNQFTVQGLTPGLATITFHDQGSGTQAEVNVTVQQ